MRTLTYFCFVLNFFLICIDQVDDDAESRFIFGKFGASLLNAGLFNNRFGNNVGNGGGFFRPFSGAGNLLPVLPVTRNPDFPGLVSNFETCTSLSQEDGICAPGAACSLFGGRPSGSCGLKGVCCVSKNFWRLLSKFNCWILSNEIYKNYYFFLRRCYEMRKYNHPQ